MWKREQRFNRAAEVHTVIELFVKSLNISYVLSVYVLLLLAAGSQPTHVYDLVCVE
jgi:hypothetical protein